MTIEEKIEAMQREIDELKSRLDELETARRQLEARDDSIRRSMAATR